MKKVFSSNSQVCHVWAQQTQSEGRASTVFFRDSVIFSYGEHYRMAKIHTAKGKKFALINSRSYSVTTQGHKSDVRSALRGLMPYFASPDVHDTRTAVKYLDLQAKASLKIPLKRLKIENRTSIQWEFERIRETFKEANELRKILGLAEKYPAKKDLELVQAHLEKRLARYQELNTPEMREKREREKQKRSALAQRKAEQKLVESIEKFRAGELPRVQGLPFDLLRVQGQSVVTSRGAEVPLPEARRLYVAVKNGLDVRGRNVGNFMVMGVYPQRNTDLTETRVIHVGCHRILLSEADRVLGEQV